MVESRGGEDYRSVGSKRRLPAERDEADMATSALAPGPIKAHTEH